MWPFASSYPECSPEEAASRSFDYIIVGGGAAGCVLASRLSENHDVSVLLIERGPVLNSWASRVPLISSNITREDSPVERLTSQPDEVCDGREHSVLVGKGLGGGTTVNSMVYMRGLPGEYNKWSSIGNSGWDYKSLLPYFLKSETSGSHSEAEYRGKTGPWFNRVFRSPFKGMALAKDAALAVGIPDIPDMQVPDAKAIYHTDLNVCIDKDGHRVSTQTAFLPTDVALQRKSQLKICTNTVAIRIAFSEHDAGDKKTVSGVFLRSASEPDGDKSFFVKAGKEVIVCAGALRSPQLLMLSGIGPRNHLEQYGVPVVRDLPGLGAYLVEHPTIPVMLEVPRQETLHQVFESRWRIMLELLKYVSSGTGLLVVPFSTNIIYARSALVDNEGNLKVEDERSIDGALPENIPDFEVQPIPYKTVLEELPGKSFFSLSVKLTQPSSAGRISLASTDPSDPPKVDLGYFTDPADYIVARKAVRFALKMANKMQELGFPHELYNISGSFSDEELDTFIRDNVRSAYHYSSTCRMAPENDPQPGVVDKDLKVYGISNLRVCDASIFPFSISTHPMASIVMIVEKCADIIKNESSVTR